MQAVWAVFIIFTSFSLILISQGTPLRKGLRSWCVQIAERYNAIRRVFHGIYIIERSRLSWRMPILVSSAFRYQSKIFSAGWTIDYSVLVSAKERCLVSVRLRGQISQYEFIKKNKMHFLFLQRPFGSKALKKFKDKINLRTSQITYSFTFLLVLTWIMMMNIFPERSVISLVFRYPPLTWYKNNSTWSAWFVSSIRRLNLISNFKYCPKADGFYLFFKHKQYDYEYRFEKVASI